MSQRAAEVVQLPTRLIREREADQLVVRWAVIRRDLHGSERAAALIEWGFAMEDHICRYGLDR